MLKRAAILLMVMALLIMPTSRAVDLAALAGQSEAAQKLGEGIDYFLGLAEGGYDREAALAAFEAAANAGSGDAWYYIGQLYANSAATGRYQQAMACYDTAISLGSAKGYYGKAGLYENGYGVPKDYDQARALFEQAVNSGFTGGYMGLGRMASRGEGVEADGIQALNLYVAALSCGDYEFVNRARHSIGNTYLEGAPGVPADYGLAMNWFRQAADEGYHSAMNNIGYMYDHGCGVEQDGAEAMAWFERSAFRGDDVAVYNMALHYRDGNGVARDDARALQLIEYSASLGYTLAQRTMGDIYYYGRYGVEVDNAMAMDWYKIAAEANDADALLRIGKMYYHGYGVSADDAEAVKWFLRAADEGSADAMDYIGYMFIYGQGVEQNNDAALNWLVRAARAAEGDEDKLDTILSDIGLLVDKGYVDWDTVDALIAGE